MISKVLLDVFFYLSFNSGTSRLPFDSEAKLHPEN